MNTPEYEKIDQREHVLLRPDTYIGSAKPVKESLFIHKNGKIIEEEIIHYPGILRLFIEILSNAIDNVIRSRESNVKVTKIKVNFDKTTQELSVWNDGVTIPIKIHEETGIYNPELIFGHLLSSSNYDDSKERYSSGRNGLGASLANIFSTSFKIEIVDTFFNKKYIQEWSNNMTTVIKPKITSWSKKTGYTQVSWIVDFERFGLKGYKRTFKNILERYLYDTSMITGLPIYFNDELFAKVNILEYGELFVNNEEDGLLLKSKDTQVSILSSNNKNLNFISFVNGIHTSDGGVHVKDWENGIFKELLKKINKQFKSKLTIRDIRPFFFLVVNSTLSQPEFSSQSKTYLAHPSPTVDVAEKDIKKIMKWSVMEKIQELTEVKDNKTLKKLEKTRGYVKIPNYDPANFAGTKKSQDCSLILCEGLSAKTYAVTGLQVGLFGRKGRDYIGILPLKGKLLNVRNAGNDKIANNKEIQNIIQALGLQIGVDYSQDISKLKYGRVITVCDSDDDGKHIEALVINLFHVLAPSLLKRNDFVYSMITPIAMMTKNNQIQNFYDEVEFVNYIKTNNTKGWNIKFLKGLGSSSKKDVLETFGQKMFNFIMDNQAKTTLIKVFDSKNASMRKEWLKTYNPQTLLPIKDSVDITEYIDKFLIRFSIEDLSRSIPNVIDGLKVSQRKCFYGLLKKNLGKGKNIKVAQLAGYIAEQTNYHHGENCLLDTIIKMAQDFVGSNNVPLFYGDGAFGSRGAGGQDAASARYIFTRLSDITRKIFLKNDDELFDYVIEDGDKVEPNYYVPIIPTILLNGSIGIGTGYSTNIPSFKLEDVIDRVERWINKEEFKSLTPYYEGFKGKIIKTSTGIATKGILTKEGDQIHITELPVGVWTDTFKEKLEDLLLEKKITKLVNHSTEKDVCFIIEGPKDCEKLLKMTSPIKINLVAFDRNGVIKQYDSIQEMIEEFCEVRLEFYVKRKKELLRSLNHEKMVLSNKHRFLNDVITKKIKLFNEKEEIVIASLDDEKYDRIDDKYDYLLNMSARQFTNERMTELENRVNGIIIKIGEIENTTEREMWLSDLNKLKEKESDN